MSKFVSLNRNPGPGLVWA